MNRHTMVAVIDGEKIQAKYLEFDNEHTLFDEVVDSDKTSDLREKIIILLNWIKLTVKDIYWEIRYGIQRVFKGYDYRDTFEIYSNFTERYYKILTDYKKNHHGHPCNLTEYEWDIIIANMLRHLYYMDEDNVNKELCKYTPEGWIVDCETTYEVIERHKNEFFKLFSEYFFYLWD